MRAVGNGLVLRPGARFWLAAGIAVALAGLVACSGPRDATGEASTSGTVHGRTEIRVVTPRAARATTTTLSLGAPRGAASTTVVTAAVVTPSAVASAASDALPTCGPADLEVAFDVQPRGGTQPADRTRALVVVTDLSSEACQLEGFVVVDAVERGRRTAIVGRHVEQPGPPAAVDLADGGSAFAGVEWSATTGCPEVSALGLGLPGADRALPVDMVVPGGSDQPLVVCSAGFLVGPLTATSEGTVAFADTVGAGT